jgi:hypothetical protein
MQKVKKFPLADIWVLHFQSQSAVRKVWNSEQTTKTTGKKTSCCFEVLPMVEAKQCLFFLHCVKIFQTN